MVLSKYRCNLEPFQALSRGKEVQGSVRGLVCGLKGGFHGGSLGLCCVVAGSLNGFIGLQMFFIKY